MSLLPVLAARQRISLLTAVMLSGLLAAPAYAGRPCEPTPHLPKKQSLEYGMRMAQRTQDVLDRSGADVVLLGRAGQDLSTYNLRYSHMGFAYRQKDMSGANVWRVLHKLNNCGTAEAFIYRQGLGEFFIDNPWRYEAVAVVPQPNVQAQLLSALNDDTRALSMNVRPYNLVSYVWGQKYQQSNQWVIETIAMAMDGTGSGRYSRSQAQSWLMKEGYVPSTLQIGPLTRLGARIGSANVAFDDHPDDKRYASRIETVTVDSVVSWMRSSRLADRVITIAQDLNDFRAPERVEYANGTVAVREPTPSSPSTELQQGYDAYRNKDYVRAFALLRPRAEAGDTQAQFTIGMMFRYGYGRAADPKEAIRWFRMAAERNHSQSEYNLGSMYGTDPLVPRDYDVAVYWLNRAQAHGNVGAKELLNQLLVQKRAQEQQAPAAQPGGGVESGRIVVRPDPLDDVAACVRNMPTACTAAEVESWSQTYLRSLYQSVRYPAAAAQAARTGEVVLSVSVCADDTVARAVVRSSSGHSDLDDAALQAVRKTAVRAPLCSGVRSPINITAPVSFSLDKAPPKP